MSPRLRPNPTPVEWQELPPDTPYKCDGEHVGDTVPGRAGGKVVACATPSRERPREGQYRLDSMGSAGRNVRKSRVRKSLHRTAGGTRKRRRCGFQRSPLLSAVDLGQALAEPSPLPYAVELEFPHEPGSSTSCALHKNWVAFELATNDARRYLLERDGDEDPALEDVADEVRRAEPKLWKWATAAHRRGLDQWAQRVQSRELVTGADSVERTRGRRASEARRRGIDMTSKNYRDDVLRGTARVSDVQSNPSARELARRTSAGVQTLARRASPHVQRAARATGVAVRRGAVATGRALATGARRAAPHVKAAARATGRAVVRGARATGRAIHRGAKRAAPHVARGLKGTAARLERWAANPSKFYWCSGPYRCDHKHPTVNAAVKCALRHVAQGDVKVMRW